MYAGSVRLWYAAAHAQQCVAQGGAPPDDLGQRQVRALDLSPLSARRAPLHLWLRPLLQRLPLSFQVWALLKHTSCLLQPLCCHAFWSSRQYLAGLPRWLLAPFEALLVSSAQVFAIHCDLKWLHNKKKKEANGVLSQKRPRPCRQQCMGGRGGARLPGSQAGPMGAKVLLHQLCRCAFKRSV